MPSKRPNVIWIVADQLRAQALGCNGDENVHTPNIDRLAGLGVNFNRAVSGYPLCCPFRGSMLTGVYPHKCVPGHEYQMPEDMPTIATVFNDNAYRTAYFGKWHLDGFKESQGRAAFHVVPENRRGDFQHWVGYENNNSQWDTWVHGDGYYEPQRLKGYETDALTDMLIDYISERSEDKALGEATPFFAVLSVQPPHDPYVAPDRFMNNHNAGGIKFRGNVPKVDWIRTDAGKELSGYYSQIENFDWNIGRVLEALHENDLYYDTHIIVFSDHGDMHGSHGQFRKTTVYEESIRIPFIMGGEYSNYDGRPIQTVDVPINHVDIAPTTLGLCQIEKPEWMEGTDYSYYRVNKGQVKMEEPDSAFIQSVIPTGHGNSCDKAWRAVVTRDGWKYACFDNSEWLLHNLNDDPYEQANLVHNRKYIGKRRELNTRLRQWIVNTGDDFCIPVL